VFVRDTCATDTITCTPRTIRVSIGADGSEANGASHGPALSANGSFVVFESSAANLVPNDTNSAPDVFIAAVPK
jgi:hypothetical protein